MVAVLFEFFLVGVVVGAAGSVAAAAIKKVRRNKFIIIEHLRVVEVSCFVWTKRNNNTPGIQKWPIRASIGPFAGGGNLFAT
jgi:hypothetical protein